jgi:hypothetical protein
MMFLSARITLLKVLCVLISDTVHDSVGVATAFAQATDEEMRLVILVE